MTVECAKETTENGTTITLFLTSDKWGISTWDLEVVDIDGNESDKYDLYFTNEKLALNEYNQAIKDNS